MKPFVSAVLFFFVLIPINGFPGPQVGILKTVSGKVVIQREQGRIIAQKGMQVEAHDILTTSDDSTAGIIFTDGTVFTSGPDTEFELRRYRFDPDVKAYDFSIYLQRGTVIYHSGKIATLAPEAVDIETPKATVGIRGTRLIITVD